MENVQEETPQTAQKSPSLAADVVSHSMAAFRHQSTYEVYLMRFSAQVVTCPASMPWLHEGDAWPWLPLHELLIRLHCMRRHWEFWFDGSGCLPDKMETTTQKNLADRARVLSTEPSLNGMTLGQLEELIARQQAPQRSRRGAYHVDFRIAKRALEEDIRAAGNVEFDESTRLTQYIRAYILFCAKMLALDDHAASDDADIPAPTRVRAMALRVMGPSPGMADQLTVPELLRSLGVPDVVYSPPKFPPADPVAAAFLESQRKANRVFAASQISFDQKIAEMSARQEEPRDCTSTDPPAKAQRVE